MATEFISIPDQAEREEITLEELVRDALEQRVLSTQFSRLFAIGDRNVKRTGAQPQDVEAEIAAPNLAVDDTCHSGHQRFGNAAILKPADFLEML